MQTRNPIIPLNDAQLAELISFLSKQRIASREKGRTTLSYLESWDVRRMLIRIFGFGGFDAEVVSTQVLHGAPFQTKHGGTSFKAAVMVTFRLHIHQLNATFTESAVGEGMDTSQAEAYDKAVKTAASDALKRCAINLGTAFGLSLYNAGDTNDVVNYTVAPGMWVRRNPNTGRIERNPNDLDPSTYDAKVGSPLDEQPDNEANEADEADEGKVDPVEQAQKFIDKAEGTKAGREALERGLDATRVTGE